MRPIAPFTVVIVCLNLEYMEPCKGQLIWISCTLDMSATQKRCCNTRRVRPIYLSQIPLKRPLTIKWPWNTTNDFINGILTPKTLEKWYYTWFKCKQEPQYTIHFYWRRPYWILCQQASRVWSQLACDGFWKPCVHTYHHAKHSKTRQKLHNSDVFLLC